MDGCVFQRNEDRLYLYTDGSFFGNSFCALKTMRLKKLVLFDSKFYVIFNKKGFVFSLRNTSKQREGLSPRVN